MIKCSKDSCDRLATSVPRINIPAHGWAVEGIAPLNIVANIPLCDMHYFNFDPADILQDQVKIGLNNQLAAKGKQPPDFDRVYITRCELDDPEYLKFIARVEERKTQAVSNKKPAGLL